MGYMTKRLFSLFLLLAAVFSPVVAQDFDQYFEDNTLRIDYVMAGNASEQHIYLDQLYKQQRWAGRRTRLAEKFLNGNGQLTVRDHATQEVIYVWTFSTLFQEWLQENEAKELSRSFEASYNIPFPKQKVDVTITLSDKHLQPVASFTHTVDPTDILIRHIGDNGIPYKFVWQGDRIEDRVDFAILAEGYTEAEMDKFYRDCDRAVEALFMWEPFRSLKEKFNVVAVAAPSQQSGPSIPHDTLWSNTAVGTHYDTFYSDRYLTSARMHRIYDLLSGVPFEHIMVLVNTEKYGGGGIYNQITFAASDHPTFREVFVHEFGHYFNNIYNHGIDISMDHDETQSQGDEMLFLAYLSELLTANGEQEQFSGLEAAQMLNSLQTILLATAVDEFEEAVYSGYYAGDNLRIKTMLENGPVAKTSYDLLFQLISEDYGLNDLYNPIYWRYVCIEAPGYYISYAMSLIPSISVYAKYCESGYEAAKEAYLKLFTFSDNPKMAHIDVAGDMLCDVDYADVLKYCGLMSAFDEKTYKSLYEIYKVCRNK